MKWIWESRKMRKNRWSLGREESTAPPACLVVKSGECTLKALTLPCTWKQEVDERGGQGDGYGERSPPWWPGFCCGVPGHLIFPPGQPRKPTCPGPGHKWTGGDLGEGGGGWWRGFAEAPGYHEITPEKIQMQLDTEEIETGTEEKDGEGGWESYWKGKG